MLWIGSVRCENFNQDIVARTFCINYTSLARFASSLCSSIMVPNAPKRKETHENLSLGSNCVDRVRRIKKFWRDFVARTLALIAPGWPICTEFRAITKRFQMTQTERNAPKNEFRVQWCGSRAFVAKNSNKTSLHEVLQELHQFGAFCTQFRAVAKRSKMNPNGKKCTKTWV